MTNTASHFLNEECYDEILRTFRIGVEVEEMKEFL